MIRRSAGILAVFLVVLLLTGAKADKPGDAVRGYFRQERSIRAQDSDRAEALGTIPAYEIVSLKVIRYKWAEYTGEDGVTGYVFYDGMIPEPVLKECEPYLAYCTQGQHLRRMPDGTLPGAAHVEAKEVFTVDGTSGSYCHVLTGNGAEGYVLSRLVTRANFKMEKISPVRFCAGERIEAAESLLAGAETAFVLEPGKVYIAEESYGNCYVLRSEDGTKIGYVPKRNTAVWDTEKDGEPVFFRLSGESGPGAKPEISEVYHKAEVREGGALFYERGAPFYEKEGEGKRLEAGELVYVYSRCGGFCAVSYGNSMGYAAEKDIEIMSREMAAERIREMDLSGAALKASPCLREGFAFLEEDNSLLLRYNAITGEQVEPLLPLGVPYFWGGRSYRTVIGLQPDYAVREAWQSSYNYYKKGTEYIYGFDCIGLVKNVYRLAGTPIEGTVTGLGEKAYCEAGHHVWCSETNPLPEDDWKKTAESLEVGDLLLVHHPGVHAMIYIGTLRDYGYTEKELPALGEALDYPLMLHCGGNPYCYMRFRDLINQRKGRKFEEVEPPDGGVAICIIGPEKEDAEMVIDYLGYSTPCYEIEGTCVTIFDFDEVESYFIYRE